jgi:NAD(P)-dependent dehydrogenase (short-subunit alcohol dehydrogenase family)
MAKSKVRTSEDTAKGIGSLKNPGIRRLTAAIQRGSEALKAEQDIQVQVERKEKQGKTAQAKRVKLKGPIQPADRKVPVPPFPKQTLKKPGVEAELKVRPLYKAPTYQGSNKLKGKVALITGGDSGIGRAVAVLFAREGADVALVYLSEHRDAEETRSAVQAEGRKAILIPGDVTDATFCQKAVKKTIQEFGKLDILVNNAAFQEHAASIEDLSLEHWDRTFKTNIYGYFFMVKAAITHLKTGGVILNSGSVTGFRGSKELLDYSSTKGAIHAFTKSLAQNLVERGIRVNGIAPGPVWTPLNPADRSPEKVAEFGSSVPMKRPAQPEEIAPAYVFLAAESDSSYITGEVLPILGGEPI